MSRKPKKTQSQRRKTEKVGRRAEQFVIIYMALKGYRCLKSRYKCKAGEIDIIFKRGKTIIFCEVKYRRDKNMLLYSLAPAQMQRIRQAAEFWFAQNRNNAIRHSGRFDFIGLTLWQKPTHIKAAF